MDVGDDPFPLLKIVEDIIRSDWRRRHSGFAFEDWDKRLVLWATDVRVRVLLARKGCWRVVIWAAGHFAGAAFRHTLIVEADATGTTKASGNG